MKKRVFEAFRIFTKWKARFRNIFRAAYKMRTHFWRDFFVYKIKIMFLNSFSSEQNERHVFEAFCIFTKCKNTLSKRLSCLQTKKHAFEACFKCMKWKKHVFKAIFMFVNEKYVFEAIFIFTKWKIRFGSVFIFTKLKNTF